MQIYKTFYDPNDFQKILDNELHQNGLKLKTFSVNTNHRDGYSIYYCIFEKVKIKK